LPIYVNFVEPTSGRCKVTALSFGMDVKRLAGGPAHLAQPQDVYFTKDVDSLSPRLFHNAAQGTRFSTVKIEIWKTARARTLIYTLKNAVIYSYQNAGASSGDFTESVSLNFESVSHQYFP
jgi:type VI secretion system secreted protein Hcp